MLRVFYLNVYVLLDLGLPLSFMTLLVTVNFCVSPKSLSEPFSVSTLVGESTTNKWVYIECPITVLRRITLANRARDDRFLSYSRNGLDLFIPCISRLSHLSSEVLVS